MSKTTLIERIPLAASMALLMGGATAFFFIAMPMVLIEQGVVAMGLPMPGPAARALVACGMALFAAGATWVGITLAGRPRRRPRPLFVVEEGLPIHLHGEEYPDAPAWRPIFASEIGVPEAEEEVEAPFARPWCDPVDYDDLLVPADDVLELVDVVVDEEPDAAPAPAEELPIAALMARLEAGVERRAAKVAAAAQSPATIGADFGALRNALEELQRMAVR